MGRFDHIRGVAGKIGELSKKLKNNAVAQAKQFNRPTLFSIAGELSKEFISKTVPGSKWLLKSVRKSQNRSSPSGELKDTREKICRLERENSSLRERVSRLEMENSSLKEMPERVSRLESEKSSWKEMRERVSRLESENSSWKEMSERVSRLESENLSLKETSERVSLLECEISSIRDERKQWQQERIMLLGSMLASATHAETKSCKTRALLLTVSGLFLRSDHFINRVVAKPEDYI